MSHRTLFSLPNNGPRFHMVAVPGTGDGYFTMGSPEDEPEHESDETQHPVQLSDFQLGEFPVTQDLWAVVLGDNPSHFKGEQRPVEQVSWFDAAMFCNALNKLLGKKPCYFTARNEVFGWDDTKGSWRLPNKGDATCVFAPGSFRLPTEAEWEYAAKGGPFAPSLQKLTPPARDYWYAGSDLLEQVGWFDKNSDGETQEVGLLLPNALGLYDMSGNVLEWCFDWYGEYPPNKTPEPNPKGAKTAPNRVLRGGDWYYNPRHCRAAYRHYSEPDYRNYLFGFRLVLQ